MMRLRRRHVKPAHPRLLSGFEDHHRALWGRFPVKITHALESTGLFTDESLASLLHRYPRTNYDLLHMAEQGTGNLRTWREGDLGDLQGDAALQAIYDGRLWLNLRRVHEADPRYAALLSEIFQELEGLVPGFRTYRHNLGILISSPRAQVYYHADVPGQSLWHLRGEKRVYIYPNRAPFLPEDQIEQIVMSFTEAEIDYAPWFEDHARQFHLRPGEMMHWPINAPHRVENLDCINVSVTTEHWTDAIRNLYAVRYANGVIRHRLRVPPPPPKIRGPSFWGRAALAAGVKRLGLLERYHAEKRIEFVLDAESPDRMRAVTPYTI